MPKLSLCDGWEYTPEWSEEFARFDTPAEAVRLPHTVAEVPLHYAAPSQYEGIRGYRRRLWLPEATRGKRVFLQFDAAGHIATVFVNGCEKLTHRCGYTAFRVEVTQEAAQGPMEIAVRLDSTENPTVPPFGFVIDYLTYGGLYREAWLDIREQSFLEDVFLYTPTLEELRLRPKIAGAAEGQKLRVRLIAPGGAYALEREIPVQEEIAFPVPQARPWTPEKPELYTCEVSLLGGDGTVLDTQSHSLGFRTAQFRADGFYLNGKKTFLRGLNRHQCYPYLGYAAPESLQRQDARILKYELGCNAVRTSHYPQSHYFLDECDRIGLMVFTEIPGWQHIGDSAWKEQACENVREMVEQYRNHTSIILWGVRINESMDNDPLYRKTNAIAHALDPSRATSGVRYIEKSSLLEDVYAYNDFSHNGHNPGAKPKKDVTPDMGKALLISECNGHMYPTKPCDGWAHRQEQALRHARVQDAAMADGEHAGCFGWCMFDYATHRDFGSGDRICYHGVLDSFRNPKLAAALYASQAEDRPVLEVGSPMDIGDYPAGQLDPVYVFTNAEEVALYRNGDFVTKLQPKGWKGLPHGPILVDDTIGSLLESKEGFPPQQAALLHRCLLAAKKYGLANLPPADKALMALCMVKYKMSFQDGVALYNKYASCWGGQATAWRFDAIKDGKVVASVTRGPAQELHLEVKVSSAALAEAHGYDMAAVRVRVLDQYGCLAPYAQYPVTFAVSGDAALVGPATVTAEGGMCGSYLRTVGRAGAAELTVSAPGLEAVSVSFTVEDCRAAREK